MVSRFSRYIIAKPQKTLIIVFMVTLFWSFFIPNLKIDFSIEHLFSKKDPNVEKYFSFREEFGREDNIISLIYKPIDYLDQTLYQELESLIYDIDEIKGVNSIISIFSISDLDEKAWLGKINGTKDNWNHDSLLLKLKYIQTDPSIGSRILSKNLEYGSIILSLNDNVNNHQARSEILERIKVLTLKTSPEWTYSGVSVLRTEYVKYMVRDNFLFLPPIAILLICILSFLFKNWVNVFLPIITVIITVIWLLGFMGLVGLDINIMTYIVPTLLFIIGIGDAIHIQAYFREKLFNNIHVWHKNAVFKRWHCLQSATPIQPLIIGDNKETLFVSGRLKEKGIWVPAIRPPTVPINSARLRITLNADHTPEMVYQLLHTLKEIEAEIDE